MLMLRLACAAFKNEKYRMSPVLEQPLRFLVIFFAVVEPVSILPIVSSLTQGANREYRRRVRARS